MNPVYESLQTNLGRALIAAFESCKKSDKLTTLTDLYVQVNTITKEIALYDDEEDLLTTIPFFEMDDISSDENVFKVVEDLIREITEEPTYFDRLLEFDLLKPFSLILVNEAFEQHGEVYLLEVGEVVIEDSLFKDIDKELDDFLDHLLKE